MSNAVAAVQILTTEENDGSYYIAINPYTPNHSFHHQAEKINANRDVKGVVKTSAIRTFLLVFAIVVLFTVEFLFKRYSSNSTKYSFSIRGPKLWNDVINKEEKDILYFQSDSLNTKSQSYSLFQKKIKSKLTEMENEVDYFNETLIILKSKHFISAYS